MLTPIAIRNSPSMLMNARKTPVGLVAGKSRFDMLLKLMRNPGNTRDSRFVFARLAALMCLCGHLAVGWSLPDVLSGAEHVALSTSARV